MNIHPLVVHFPIGLLVTYSVLELGAYFLSALRRRLWLFPVKAFLLFVGVLGALMALLTGSMAAESVEGTSRFFILDVHAPFAGATTVLYLVLAAAYLVRVFDMNGWGDHIVGANTFLMRIWSFKKFFCNLVLNTWFLPVLAFLALVSITITGALGAALVYGPDADPFVFLVYHLFWTR